MTAHASVSTVGNASKTSSEQENTAKQNEIKPTTTTKPNDDSEANKRKKEECKENVEAGRKSTETKAETGRKRSYISQWNSNLRMRRMGISKFSSPEKKTSTPLDLLTCSFQMDLFAIHSNSIFDHSFSNCMLFFYVGLESLATFAHQIHRRPIFYARKNRRVDRS